jgi:hypothetical protein
MARRGVTTVGPLSQDGVRLLERFSDEVQEIMLRLRDRVLGFAPDVHEIITDARYTVSLQYGNDDKVGHCFCYIAGFSKHANLGFQRGASIPDPENVLDGTGAYMRHIKFSRIEQTRVPWLDAYLEAARAQSRRRGHERDDQMPNPRLPRPRAQGATS